MKKVLIIVLATLLFAGMLVGCTSEQAETSETSSQSEATAAETSESVDNTSVESASTGPKTVALVPPGMTSPYHSVISEAAQEAADALGWTLEVQAPPSEDDFAGQVSIIESYIAQGVDAIATFAIDDEAIIPAVQQANEAGIPVFLYCTQTPLEGCDITEYIGYNHRSGAESLGEYAGELLEGQGKVFILEGYPSFVQIERTEGFLEGLEAYPDIEVVGSQSAEWVRETAVNVATQALQKDPDINLIYANADEMAIGASIAAANLGLDVYILGIDGNPVTLDEIAAGNFTATLGVYPADTGTTIINQINKYFNGEDIPQYLLMPTVIVDASNLEDYMAGKLWTEPTAGEPEILDE